MNLRVLDGVVQSINHIIIKTGVFHTRILIDGPRHNFVRIHVDAVQPFVAVLDDEKVVGKAILAILKGLFQKGDATIKPDSKNLKPNSAVAISIEVLEELLEPEVYPKPPCSPAPITPPPCARRRSRNRTGRS